LLTFWIVAARLGFLLLLSVDPLLPLVDGGAASLQGNRLGVSPPLKRRPVRSTFGLSGAAIVPFLSVASVKPVLR
jgi:hypothetical protein